MYKNILFGMLILIFLAFGSVLPCYADTGLAWSGDLTVEENSQDSQWSSLDSILQLKTEFNGGEKLSSVILLKCQTPGTNFGPDSDLLSVNQAYLDFMPTANFLFRAGRQRISWGTAFSWNPTNYIGSGKNRAEFMVEGPGVDAVDAECTWENSSITVLLKPENSGNTMGKAIKISAQVSHRDFSISGFQQDSAKALGADFATSLGNCALYCEAAWKAGDSYFYIDGSTERERPPDRYFLHGVIGVNSNLVNDVTVLCEYYYNQEGWTQKEADDFYNYFGMQTDPQKIAELSAKKSALLGDLRQNYLFVMFRKEGFLFDDFILSASILWNMDDQSYLLTPMVQYNIGPDVYLALNINATAGNAESEFGSQPFHTMTNAKVVWSF